MQPFYHHAHIEVIHQIYLLKFNEFLLRSRINESLRFDLPNNSSLSTAAPNKTVQDRYTIEVVAIAAMVPVGIDA